MFSIHSSADTGHFSTIAAASNGVDINPYSSRSPVLEDWYQTHLNQDPIATTPDTHDSLDNPYLPRISNPNSEQQAKHQAGQHEPAHASPHHQ